MKNNSFSRRRSCPVCGSAEEKRIYSIPYLQNPLREFLHHGYPWVEDVDLFQANYTLIKCNNCGLIYQKEIPSETFMQKLYRIENPEETYNIHLKKRNLDAGLGHMREIAFIIKYLDQHPSHLHFLDFGMGWGDWCLMAKALGCNAFGCELSQNKIYYANNNGISNIPFTEIGKDRWDFINTEQVMEHTSNPVDLVRHLSDSLKPGGILKISVPDRNYGVKEIDNANMSTNLFKTYKDFYSTSVQPLEHINCFHRPSLVHLGKTAELEYVTTPVLAQYVSSVTGSTIKKLCKNALKPIFRALFKKNYIFLKKAR